MTNPTFSRIAASVRQSPMPAEMKNKLLLLFYRLPEPAQKEILTKLETNTETLPIFAELLTELEQNKINPTDQTAIELILEKYLNRLS